VRIGIHAVSAKLGGAVTYLKHLLPELVRQLSLRRNRSQVIVWHSGLLSGAENWAKQAEFREVGRSHGPLIPATNPIGRLWFDQVSLPRVARRERLDAVFATANFCSLRPACGQVLLVRNTVPFDRLFLERIPRGARIVIHLQRQLILRSIVAADVVLFPSATMLDFAANAMGGSRSSWRVAPFGVALDLFKTRERRDTGAGNIGPVRLLNISTYSDQKNLGTLLRAMEILSQREPGSFKLRLTAGFSQRWIGESPMFPSFFQDAELYARLAARGEAEEVEWLPYEEIPQLYASADIFVFPSYTESFGHPLAEAMGAGLPIIAADTPINREMCAEAAMYVPAFDQDAFASAIQRLARDAEERGRLSALARQRALRFRWSDHAAAVVGAISEVHGPK